MKIPCIKCGKRHYAINGRETCSACFGQKNRPPKIQCKECGKSCLNSGNEGICGVCRFLNKYREEHIPNARRCTKCNRVLRTKKEYITICTRKECGGTANYYKTIRAYHKSPHLEEESLNLKTPIELETS